MVDAYGNFHNRGLRISPACCCRSALLPLLHAHGARLCHVGQMDVSCLWLAYVALVIQAAVGQQAYHSVTFGSFWIQAIVTSSAAWLSRLALQLKALAKGAVAMLASFLLTGWTAAHSC